EYRNGSWSNATNDLGGLNDVFNNALLGTNAEGTQWYLLNSYRFRVTPKVSIATVSVDEGGGFSDPDDLNIRRFFPEELFYDAYVEDNSGVIIVAMDYQDTYGSEDLYVLQQNAKGKYTELTNLGDKINTAGYEIAPFLSPDGKRLYFTSDGHGGLGDADIFYAERLDDTWTNWSEPVNVGAPINSESFDAYYFQSKNGDVYFSSNRGEGALSDIYQAKYTPEEETDIEVEIDVEPEPEPEPVEPEPAPEPEPVPEPEPEPTPEPQPEPEPEPQLQPAPREMPGPTTVYFELDSYALSDQAKAKLSRVMQQWDQAKDLTLVLEGHACQIGEVGYNDKLSLNRAETVWKYLKDGGYSVGYEYQIEGLGENSPVVGHDQPGANPKNRCVRISFQDTNSGSAR
ncbi:MAG: OmpA family protein, partial [Bacteroidota bacterium]